MSTESAPSSNANSQILFWGCFIALITTAFAFVGRLFLINAWSEDFALDPAEAGRLAGIGIWPFAVSIILFSLVIDKIGYKTAMVIASLGHLTWAAMGVSAYFVQDTNQELGFQLLYWGSLICALANGTVEAFINPVVATMFSKEKTKWLNILHAGWPGGLVITGLLLIGIDTFASSTPWAVKVGLIAVPAVVYFVMLIGRQFPEQERVSAGVSYREMLQEFGVGGALIVSVLIVLQLMDFFSNGGAVELSSTTKLGFVALGVLMVGAFGAYTRSMGRGLLLFLIVIMMPLATTEIGTDGWITGIMEDVAKEEGFHSGWILVYTSAIMLVLRFMAGPIVHTLSPLGLLAISAVLAIFGLTYLSAAQGFAIFTAATLYGFGKTFFWPTMLGVVSEQCPKGGALTLNAIAGIGMLAVGTLGFPYIGVLQTRVQQEALVENEQLNDQLPGLVESGEVQPVTEKTIYEILSYEAIDDKQLAALIEELPEDEQAAAAARVAEVRGRSNQRALRDMAIFPIFMLACYLILIVYFKAKGGYSAEVLTGHEAKDEKYTGGVEAPVEA
ncbi:MAG: MFS transporter [Planctomycetota bacterium]|nr:MAG: MFS transporter [Planctomycetota bacterium]REJ92280.1 MAG: MFS transporter [Planctomycetota bacterium]REK28479.1 MAG: MFS transporter [Planctomycetota bacterium]REK29101.1 MAG: MFS transporter [Planctomycetota bacterium]